MPTNPSLTTDRPLEAVTPPDHNVQPQARQHFERGLQHFHARQFNAARDAFDAALRLAPGRLSVLINLAATCMALNELEAALAHADAALALDEQATEAWLHRGHALAQMGSSLVALQALDTVVALDAAHATAWVSRGHVLREAGRLDEARRSYNQALVHGAEPSTTAYFLAAVAPLEAASAPDGSATATPPSPPRAYVEALFDSYAQGFESHVQEGLGYDAPTRLWQAVEAIPRPTARFAVALDVGCGTGLCARRARPHVDHLTGVDLSLRMVEAARATGLYDAVQHDDLVNTLQAMSTPIDLVLAADVFIYVGDLAPAFSALAPKLRDSALVAFSVECPADLDQGLRLMPSLRYAHSRAYLTHLALQHGLAVATMTQATVRRDQGQDVPGLYVVLQRSVAGP
jgi:predicted TPR repeat methyltransferase